MNHEDLLQVLQTLEDTFKTRKELVHFLQNELDININYNTLKTRWQNHKEYAAAIDALIYSDAPQVTEVEPQLNYRVQDDPVKVTGAALSDHTENVEETFRLIQEAYTKKQKLGEKKAAQSLEFSSDVICLVNTADIHFGEGCDIASVFSDLEIIENTPNMFVNWLGDLTDNFISGWTLPINLQNTITPQQQLNVAKLYLKRLSAKLKIFTAGNHDLWSSAETGIDPIFEYLMNLDTNLLYDEHENVVNLIVGKQELLLKVRHQWRGYSIYNQTHGIERAHFQAGNGFDIGVGGHYHNSGLYREFTGSRGLTCAAINCGTYKVYDSYSKKIGFPATNDSKSIALVIDGRKNSTQRFYGFHNLEAAANFLKFLKEN